jgi:hypothetical protein
MDYGLLETVRRLTGRQYVERVAAILRVISPKAGLSPVEAGSLRKRAYRKKRPA